MAIVRRLLVSLSGATAAAALTAVMIIAGPRREDLPSELSAVPDWIAADPEHALTTVVGFAAWACLLWLCAGFVLGGLTALPGIGGRAAAAIARHVMPRTMRHIVEIALGASLAAGSASPALAVAPSASPGSPGWVSAASSTVWPDLDIRGSVPAAADTSPAATPTPPATATSDPGRSGHIIRSDPAWPDLDIRENSRYPMASGSTSWATAEPPRIATGPAPSTSQIPNLAAAVAGPAVAPAGAASTPPAAEPSTPTSPTSIQPPTAALVGGTHQRPADSAPTPGASAGAGKSSWPDLNPQDLPGPDIPDPGTPSPPPTALNPIGEEVVVSRDDTLWTIAARHLGSNATIAQIAGEWPRWWAANRHVIGSDPDIILPGQRLRPPQPGP